MSEYQYYEFLAIDRPLTNTQMRELRDVSSRARITPNSFVNVYNWGNFRGTPRRLMEQRVDAFVYVANWGSRRLMLRLPRAALEAGALAPYCVGESFSMWETGEHFILSYAASVEPEDCEEGDGRFSSLVPLRADLVVGDTRSLYLGWLLCAQCDELDDDESEPPVPPGLRSLSGPLSALVEFLGLQCSLVEIAAERSDEGATNACTREDLAAWLATLPASEKDAMLAGLAEGHRPYLGLEILRRCSRSSGPARCAANKPRTVADLLRAAEAREEKKRRQAATSEARRRAREERERAVARDKELDWLSSRQAAAWREVEANVATRTSSGYVRAVAVLSDLRDLAVRSNRQRKFAERVADLRARHEKKSNFLKELDRAGIPGLSEEAPHP